MKVILLDIKKVVQDVWRALNVNESFGETKKLGGTAEISQFVPCTVTVHGTFLRVGVEPARLYQEITE